MIDGTWIPIEAELDSQPLPADNLKSTKLILSGINYSVYVGNILDRGIIKLDATKSPHTMVINGTEGPNKGKTILAIYDLHGETLTVCYDLDGQAYPKDFKTYPNSSLFLVTYNRQRT